MKPINEWFDSEYNITNRVYRFENGVELLHSQNPATKDFVFSSVLHAGAAFESMMGVPDGTAHFLEHLFIEPNTRFKTKHMIDRFEYGDRSRPSLYVNAATSVKYLYLYGSCNEKGRDRLLERMDSILDYPDNWFEKYMRKERSVILAEHSHMYKREKDPDFQLVRFLIGKDLPHLTKRVIGEVDDIKQITPDDLRRFRSGLFLPKNTVFAVHSSGELSVKVRQDLERMADRFGNSDVEVFPPDEQLENRFDLRSFRDSREEGVSMSLNYFFEKTKTVDYPRRVLRALASELFQKVGFDYLREKKGLVYSFQVFSVSWLTYQYRVSGFKCTTPVDRWERLLPELDNVIYERVLNFLTGREGKVWFEHAVSRYMYPNTTPYEYDYAEKRALDILDDTEVWVFDRAVEIAKTTTREDLCRYVEKEILAVPPRMWVLSPYPKEKILAPVYRSPLYRRWTEHSISSMET